MNKSETEFIQLKPGYTLGLYREPGTRDTYEPTLYRDACGGGFYLAGTRCRGRFRAIMWARKKLKEMV